MFTFNRLPITILRRFISDVEHKRIQTIISGKKVVLFMKGTPLEPMCGFSKAMVQLFQSYNVPIQTYDVIADSKLRQDMKEFSDWPTFPQIYIGGEFKGGCDILLELHHNEDLKDILKQSGVL